MNSIFILYDYEEGMHLIRAFDHLEDAETWRDGILEEFPGALLHITELEIL